MCFIDVMYGVVYFYKLRRISGEFVKLPLPPHFPLKVYSWLISGLNHSHGRKS